MAARTFEQHLAAIRQCDDSPWRALLDGEAARRARDVIAEIEILLAGRVETLADPSLAEGHAGIAIMHGYRALAGDAAAEDDAVNAIGRAIATAGNHPRPWLFDGTAGVAFALHHLAPVIGEADEALAELDQLVATVCAITPWAHRIELMFGLAGLGVYALERGDRAQLQQIIAQLAAASPAHVDDDNVGIAHGLAGIVGFLARTCQRSDPPAHARALLDAALARLRRCERPAQVPRFPMVIGPVEGVVLDGWCYGDPAAAIVLASAARALGDDALLATARDLARCAASRTDAELATLAIDTALCHGAIGRAHLFNRLGQAFDDELLLSAARDWYGRAIDRCDSAALAVLPSGLLTGIAGIALCLLAGVTPIEPCWDRALLIALPVGGVRGQDRVEAEQEPA